MIGKIHKIRGWLLFSLFSLAASLIIFRLVSLQWFERQEFVGRARKLHRRIVRIPPRRGSILDARGDILAASLRRESLYAVPSRVTDPVAAAAALASLLRLDPARILRRLKAPKEFVWIKRQLSPETARQIEKLDLAGLFFRPEMKRIYPGGSLLSQILGITDIDGKGIDGLELKYNVQLQGSPGWRVSEKDSKQREVIWLRSGNIEPIDGCNLILNIDGVIQDIVENELEEAFQEYQARWASAVVMEPATGNVLAMANLPGYDPNLPRRPGASFRRNRAVTDRFEPGSTFKIFPAAAALEEGVVTLDSVFYCENGIFWIGGCPLHDHKPHGKLTLAGIIQKSSNIGMAKVGMLLGEEKLYRGLRKFGLIQRTGIDLLGEVRGFLRPPSRWSKISLSRITMGHEVAVTPLGLLSAFCALGNKGMVLKPRIIARIESPTGKIIYRFRRVEKGRAVSAATSRKVLRALRLVVEEGGTGTRAAIPGYEVAGKTGTAQKLDPAGGYSHRDFESLFMGLFPVSRPRIAILVVIDSPRGAHYGGTVSAPVFRRIGEGIINYLHLSPPEVS